MIDQVTLKLLIIPDKLIKGLINLVMVTDRQSEL